MTRLSTVVACSIALTAACGDDGAATPDTTADTTNAAPTGSSTSDDTPADDSGSSSSSSSSSDPSTGSSSTSPADSSSSGGGSELDPRVENCLRIDACEADGGTPIGVQACLAHVLDLPWSWASTGVQRMSLAVMECKLAAADCAGVLACAPPIEPFAEACAAAPGSELCDGDTWVFCDFDGLPIAAMDCAAAGSSCSQDIWAGCGTEACTFGVTEPECDGDELVQCSPFGALQRIDCATQYNYVNVNGKRGEEVYAIAGETCGYDMMMSALGCIGTGEACGFFEQSCTGDVLETCAGGALAQRDCATLDPSGQSCGFWTEGPFAGAATCGYVEPPCALDADETCTDGAIGYCEWDHTASVDCVAQGYDGCATADADGRTIAYCTSA